jgi:hypothetical protein
MITLRSVRPQEPQEVADTDARLLSQILIGTFAILSIVPFVGWMVQH